jgi:hypothetical protein
LYTLDYNNYYAPTYIGYCGSAITTLTAWQGQVATDQHSVSIAPVFIDSSISLELSVYNNDLLCPVADIRNDIKGNIRPSLTIMGAYTRISAEQDLMLERISQWNTEVIDSQYVQVNVDLLNTATLPITTTTFGWSLNGTPQTSISWTPTSPLNSLEKRNIFLAEFQAIDADAFNVVVWVETINGISDTVKWNDTVSAAAIKMPLVEFVTSLADTVFNLNFNISARIRTITGAPVSTPKLYMERIINKHHLLYDTIPMVLLDNNIWQATTIPQQYYESKIIYSLVVSDTNKTTKVIMDSTYTKYIGSEEGIEIIGTGTTTSYNTPVSMYYEYGLSRQIYLYSEISPNLSPQGVFIDKIAWQSSTATANFTNQTCYMRATSETVENAVYVNPLVASKVWTGTLNIAPGWVEITLDEMFFLPPNMNLEIFWDDQSNSYVSNSHVWLHTSTSNYATAYSRSSSPITSATAVYTTSPRPNIRISKGSPSSLYKGHNLQILELLSPLSNMDNLCAIDYEPLTIVMKNFGKNDYDFTKDSILLVVKISEPTGVYSEYRRINTGVLNSEKQDTIELIASLPFMHAGQYDIKVWVESSVDNIPYDDTLFYLYESGKIKLPMDDSFDSSVLSSNFTSASIVGTDSWTPYSDSTSTVQPNFGNGLLRYVGAYGTMAHLTVHQLDLSGVVNPELKFWYYHDSTASPFDMSYTDVNIIADGITFNELSIFKRNTIHGWKEYTVDLNPYTSAQCILIEFIATNKYGVQSAQYIDRILITSTPDLAISEIIVSPEVTVCNTINKELKAVLTTMVNQATDLQGKSLTIQIGTHPPFTYPLSKVMAGNSSDTISLITNVDLTNISSIEIYLTSPVDNIPSNDTAKFLIDIRPQLAIEVISLTEGKDCFKKGIPMYQDIVLQNLGNVDLSGIELELRITGDSSTQTVKETKPIDLLVDSSMTYTFENAYTVPAEVWYQVQVSAWLGCKPALVNVGNAIEECVDLHDLSMIEINNPPSDRIDKVNSTDSLTVSVRNTDDHLPFKDVIITALIEDKNGQLLNTLAGIISEVAPSSTLSYTFIERYIVPEDSSYSIRVYLTSNDIYPDNDTLFIQQQTNYGNHVGMIPTGKVNTFTLGQNIPNPANNSTRIDYSVPEAGEVVFHVHSISGQLLYSKTIETERGTNSIELNTSTFAAGVYFYSMEYKGQRLVRQLIINN